MGEIVITVRGSFEPSNSHTFSAMYGGHAVAVGEAIEWLAAEVLPKAIQQDHQLQRQGEYPAVGFGLKKLRITEERDPMGGVFLAVQELYALRYRSSGYTPLELLAATEEVIKAWDKMLD